MRTNTIRSRIGSAIVAAVAALTATAVIADDPVINALSPTTNLTWPYELTWTCHTNGVTEFRVEGSPTCEAGMWTNDVVGITPTGTTMSTSVQMRGGQRFYRVAADMADYMVVDLTAGPSAASYPVSYLTAVPTGGWTDEYKTTKLVMRLIPAGTFTMGSPTNELGRGSDETQHQVTLTQPFYIGVFEVTQKQWERVIGTWPSCFTNVAYRDTRPVEWVSCYQIRENPANSDDPDVSWPSNSAVNAESFMGRLRARTGRAFDLPTESQWEYAGRAGTTTALNSGHNLTNTASDAHMSEVGRYWHNGGSGYSQGGSTTVGTAKAGSYLPNQWGLYDIHGNVWEWCLDWVGTYPGTVSNPPGAPSGSLRVLRGGCWYSDAYRCRVAFRYGGNPDYVSMGAGFRVALPSGQ